MPTEADIYAGLTEIFHDVFMRDDLVLSSATTAQQVEGWDSFKQIELIISSEAKWRIKFTTRELDGLASVGDLVGAIARKTA